MRAREFLKEAIGQGFHVYGARVKVSNPSYATSIDVAIFAKSPAMARLLLKAQYGDSAVVTNVYKIS
jgi:hypothetical protein